MVPVTPEDIQPGFFGKEIVYFIAEDEQTHEAVGCVMGADHVEIFNDPENGCSLWALAADPQARYPGIGKGLVLHVLNYFKAKGRDFLDLSVMHDSDAKILYEKMGFHPVPVFTLKRKNVINERLYVGNFKSEELNPYATIIVNEARRRGIGINVLDAKNNYFSLNHGGRAVVCWESLSELTTAIAMSRCADKALTHSLLGPAGILLPPQHIVADDESDFNFLKLHKHIAVKPADGEQGMGVSLMVQSPDELELAIKRAREISSKVVLEKFIEGEDLRIVVIKFEVVAAAIRKPAEVVGDGKHQIIDLIKKQSRRREMATHGESSIPIDKETENCIQSAGYALSDVLPPREVLRVRKTANLHTGGTIHDVTADLHPALKEAAVKVAKTINIPVVGVDFIVNSPEKDAYVFIEANERPGLANHEPQPTAQKFIDMLFPDTRSPGASA
jgi:GNAT-family acetyltransferase (TIGR03103 family)